LTLPGMLPALTIRRTKIPYFSEFYQIGVRTLKRPKAVINPTEITEKGKNGETTETVKEITRKDEELVAANDGKASSNRFPYGRVEKHGVREIPGLMSTVFFFTYSALHATVWNASFPTVQEKWTWRVSCLLITAKPFLLYLIAGIVIQLRLWGGLHAGPGNLDGRYKSNKLLNVFFVFLYLGGTWTLLFESFFSLRNLPKGAYETVPWSVYLPHL
jgi:hypothetical protein